MAITDDTMEIPAPALRRDWGMWVLILGFGLCIAIPCLVQILGSQSVSTENRTLAPMPTLPAKPADVMKLPQQIEAYLNDHFGLRNQMVYLNSLVKFSLGVSTSPAVAIGRQHFLFYTYEPERLMEQHIGEDVYTPEALNNWLKSIAGNAAWLAERGIAYYVIVAPDKSTIYPEYLPDYPPLPNSTTRLDQIAGALGDRHDIEFIDPRAAIMAQKPLHRMYPRADSHWGVRSAFTAYSLLMHRIKQRFPTVNPVTLDDFDVTVQPSRGDLAIHLNLYQDLLYNEEHLQYRGNTHILGIDHLPPEPGWGWPITQVHTNLQQSPKILIQGDSFTDYVMGPLFMYQTFKEMYYVHHNGTILDKKLIEDIHPDIVVLELAERYLQIN